MRSSGQPPLVYLCLYLCIFLSQRHTNCCIMLPQLGSPQRHSILFCTSYCQELMATRVKGGPALSVGIGNPSNCKTQIITQTLHKLERSRLQHYIATTSYFAVTLVLYFYLIIPRSCAVKVDSEPLVAPLSPAPVVLQTPLFLH